MTNETLKNKVTAKLIKGGFNEDDAHKMVEAEFENALECGVAGVARLAEFICTVA
jgi:LDH2 family malate/lactate/ureidoglycolate dehydrogenase